MKGPTFNQLLVFRAIVAEGTIRGAARRLEMTPPSVSQSLKILETYLGLPLFTRTTRLVELTEAGHQLHERTHSVISELEQALESVRDLSEEPSGKVRVTLPRFIYHLFLQPIYAEFCERYPKIELEISLSDAVVNIISEGFDVGIRLGDRIDEGMVAKRLSPPMKEALFASDQYIERYGMPAKLEDLKHHKLVQYRFIASNQLAPLDLVENGEIVRIEMPVALIVNDTEALVDAAKRGLGIGRMVEPVVKNEIELGIVKPVLRKHWCPYPEYYAYFAQHSQKARRIRVFLDFLAKKAMTHW